MRLYGRLVITLVLLAPPANLLLSTMPATADSPRAQVVRVPPDDPGRGLRYGGLFPGRPGGPCSRLYEMQIDVPGRALETVCTHGPDPAPPGFDVQTPRAPQAPAEGPGAGATAALACPGNGTDGYRVQVLYARASDKSDRFGQFQSSFVSYVNGVDAAVSASAAETGSDQHVRWVTDSACNVVIQQAQLTATGDDSLDNTIRDLRTLGYTSSSRKYLVFVDANVYCGIAQIRDDDRANTAPGANYNNGHTQVQGMVARVDSGCWSASVAAHELMHNLGGVQQSAPHVTPGWHCTDESDRMCYDDDGSGPVRMTQVCPSAHEERFDCNHDDYYSTAAPAGSYLATHWNTANSAFLTPATSSSPPRRAPADFDGNGSTDVSVFRPSAGAWFVRDVLSSAWGVPGDLPVPGDYDGDGKADRAVYRPSQGVWFVAASGGTTTTQAWGVPGDIPVPGDYDGDGRADLAVYRPSQGVWFVAASGGTTTTQAWGVSGEIPVPADYDGDGKTDLAVYRPSQGVWFVKGSAGTGPNDGWGVAWGVSGDIPVPGDYDNDGKADRAVFRPSQGVWFVKGSASSAGDTSGVAWGVNGDLPVPGDYDGNGSTDMAVYRPGQGVWFVRNGAVVAWGVGGDVPLPLPAAIHSFFVAP